MNSPLVVLKESLAHFRKFFSLYLGYSAWILVPTVGIVVLDILPKSDMFSITELVTFMLVVIGTMAIVWASVIMIHLAQKLESNDPVDFQAIQITSMKQVAPLLFVALLQLLVVLGGFLLLIIPMFLFIVWYSFAQISVVLENKRGMEALVYSKSLVKGHYWYTAWGMIGVPALVGLTFAIVTGTLAFIFASLTGQNIDILMGAEQEPVWITAIDTIGQMVIIPLMSIYSTKFYLQFKEAVTKMPLEHVEKVS